MVKPVFYFLSQRHWVAIAILGFIVVGFFVFGFIENTAHSYSELKEIEGVPRSFDEYADFFEDLAEEKGGKYALGALSKAELGPRTDFHLLGHVVGDVLYKQKGVDGMHDCTHEFRNACSHSIVTGVFTEYGPSGLGLVTEACEQAPGSKGAYSMCFHGLGHGVLAYALYDFKRAVSLCEDIGDIDSPRREVVECIGGAVMEIVGGGDHDPVAWEKQHPHYLKAEDPLYPCNASFVPQEAKGICYIYLTPHLLELVGFSFGNPDPALFPKAYSYCDTIPKEQKDERAACYGGFGKEFFGYVNDGDIRDIGSSLSNVDAVSVRNWCLMAEDERDKRSCLLQSIASLFWGGESNVDGAFKFCALMEDKARQTLCYSTLTDQIVFYSVNSYKSKALCKRLPEIHKKRCLSKLP